MRRRNKSVADAKLIVSIKKTDEVMITPRVKLLDKDKIAVGVFEREHEASKQKNQKSCKNTLILVYLV